MVFIVKCALVMISEPDWRLPLLQNGGHSLLCAIMSPGIGSTSLFFLDKPAFVPSISFQDSSSLLIYSISGYTIKHELSSGSKPTEKEKTIIFEHLLKGIPGISCIYKLTLEKLATADSISRFIGDIIIAGFDSWYIADIQGDTCKITILGAADGHSSEFYCAYSFGVKNLPDVFVRECFGDYDKMEKMIFYKSKDRWVYTMCQKEYKRECFNEEE